MKKISLLSIAVLFVILAGCTSSPSEEGGDLTVIHVDIQLPKSVELHEEISLKTHVTLGEENVEDAYEVQFEIWNVEEGKEKSKLVDAPHIEEGIYQIEEVFEKKGIYHIQAHVTARDMHVMPTKQLVVGELSEKEMESIMGKQAEKKEEDDNGHSGHH